MGGIKNLIFVILRENGNNKNLFKTLKNLEKY